MSHFLQIGMGRTFSAVFLALSVLLMGLASYQFVDGLEHGKELISIFVQSVNTGIIALAIFELGIGIGKEYANSEQHEHTFYTIRRMVARFVGTVCIALVLESLIMIIKYSQLDLAGNLFYPVGILAASSVMLCSLGVFLHFSRADCEVHGRRARIRSSRDSQGRSGSEQRIQQTPRKKLAAAQRRS